MKINHVITCVVGTYDKYGRYAKHVSRFEASTNYEYKTRKGLERWAENVAFWNAYHDDASFCYLLEVDGSHTANVCPIR